MLTLEICPGLALTNELETLVNMLIEHKPTDQLGVYDTPP